jgi:hypothetical protein
MAARRAPWLAGGLVAAVAVQLLMVAVPVRGRFVVEKSSVRVLAPEHIRGHHDAAIGNFGVPDYGGTLTGVVIYPDKKATGCDEFDTKFKAKSRRPVILLLDRGGPLLLLFKSLKFLPFIFLNELILCLALKLSFISSTKF